MTIENLERMTREERQAERDRLAAAARQILDRSNGTLSDDARVQYDEHLADLTAIRDRNRHEDDQRALIRAAADNPGAQEGIERGTPGGDDGRRERGPAKDPWTLERNVSREAPHDLRSRALTAIERVTGLSDAAKQYATKLIEADPERLSPVARYTLETSRPDYLRAFGKWLGDPTTGHLEWSVAERDAHVRVRDMQRALNITTGSAGQFMLPFTLDPQLTIANTGSVNPMRELANVRTVATNEYRAVTTLGSTASWDPEAQEVSDDSPVLVQPTLKNFKGQVFTPVSFEFFEDSDISSQVSALFADSKAQLEATAYTLGAGTTEPKGIVTNLLGVAGSVVITSATAFAAAELFNNQNALPARWRPNAKWMMNLSIINGFRGVIKGTGLTESIIDDSGPRARTLGWEIYENSIMDGTISAAAADYLIISGDFKAGYQIIDRLGSSLELVPQLFGAAFRPTGQRGFLLHWRTGGDVVIPDAFRLTNYSA